MSSMLSSALLLLVLPLLAAALPAQDEGGPAAESPQQHLRGVVRGVDGKAWAGAAVHVLGRRFFWTDRIGDECRKVVTADARGRFRVRVPADRDYSVYAVTPEDEWRETGRYRITPIAENAGQGQLIELQAEPDTYRIVQLEIQGLDRFEGEPAAWLLGKSINFDRMQLPFADGAKLVIPPRPDPSPLVEICVGGVPITTASPSRVRSPDGDEGMYQSRYEIPEFSSYEITVLDKGTKKPIPNVQLAHVVYEGSYTDLRAISYEVGRYVILRPLGPLDAEGRTLVQLPTSRTSRGNSYARLRAHAPGYSILDASHFSQKAGDADFEFEPPEEEGGKVTVRILLETEKARTLRFVGGEGAGVAGLRVVYRGQARTQIQKNSYRGFYLDDRYFTSGEDGRIRLPAFSDAQPKNIELLVDDALGRVLGLDPQTIAQLPPSLHIHDGPLWGAAADKEVDVRDLRLVRGEVRLQSGLPWRSPLVSVEPTSSRRHMGWQTGLGSGMRGERSGEFWRLLLPGKYLFAAFEPEQGYLLELVEVPAGEGTIEKTFTLESLCHVEGRILDANGQPLPGAELSVAGWSMSGSSQVAHFAARFNQRRPLATSDDLGRFRFSFIPTDALRMRFRASFRHDGRSVSGQMTEEFQNESRQGVELVVPVDRPKPEEKDEKKDDAKGNADPATGPGGGK